MATQIISSKALFMSEFNLSIVRENINSFIREIKNNLHMFIIIKEEQKRDKTTNNRYVFFLSFVLYLLMDFGDIFMKMGSIH